MDTKKRIVRREPQSWIVQSVADSMAMLIDAGLKELRENWTAPLVAGNVKAIRFLQEAMNAGRKS